MEDSPDSSSSNARRTIVDLLRRGKSKARFMTEVYASLTRSSFGPEQINRALAALEADGAIMVIRAGTTRYAMVDRLLNQLPRERMLGVVLNRVDEELDSSSYYYEHDYYNRGNRQLPPQPRTRLAHGQDDEVTTVN